MKGRVNPGKTLGRYKAYPVEEVNLTHYHYILELQNITLKMSYGAVRLIARNVAGGGFKLVRIPISIVPLDDLRGMADQLLVAIGATLLGFLFLLFFKLIVFICGFISKVQHYFAKGLVGEILNFIFGMTGMQVIARAVNGFCLGRIIVWTLVTGKLFSPDMEFKLSVFFIIIFTIMFASSLAVRAIVSVILVTFAGKMTKFLMFLAILSLFVSACTGSVMTNMVEAVMGVACKQMTLIELRIQSLEAYAAPLL